MKKPALVGTALVVIGVAAGSLLAPKAASALDFTFSFGGVTGLIEGLSQGTNRCHPADPCRVTVTNNGGTGAPLGPYRGFPGDGIGFDVITPPSGTPSIAYAAWGGFNGSVGGLCGLGELWFGTQGDGFVFDGWIIASGPDYYADVVGLAQFTAVGVSPDADTAVPAPLPLFGAAAAFGFSRKLRNHIKRSRNSASSTYTL